MLSLSKIVDICLLSIFIDDISLILMHIYDVECIHYFLDAEAEKSDEEDGWTYVLGHDKLKKRVSLIVTSAFLLIGPSCRSAGSKEGLGPVVFPCGAIHVHSILQILT